ncbi:MAG TPA: trypsin-like serine protease [Luteolibacter sp.]|nr:trypsin-like serine protease [Luteolibacter sp.]
MNARSIPLAKWSRGFLLIAGLCCGAGVSNALEIRTYSAARHDRFTGYPGAPEFNDSAYYESRKFTGVAWIPGEGNSRQFALVSPKHVVFARHFLPGIGTTLRFLGSGGTVVDRTITNIQEVLNGSSLPTDLCLLTLSSPLTSADGVAHFPYLNLSAESAYTNATLTVFGWDAKAGRGTVNGFEDSNISGINTTRLMRFRYLKGAGNQDDARVVVGDSGSPTFGSAGGNPAILGIHTAAGETTFFYNGYDSFIPHYIGELNALMAGEGYRMTPAYPPAVTLATSLVTPSPLKQAYAGTCHFDLSNMGSNDAGNARVTLHFPSGFAPDSITASGWIAESQGPQDWVFRRANLAAGAVSEFHVSWDALPAVSVIPVDVSRAADGSPSASQTFGIFPSPTFKAWAAGLADETQGGDPDNDGASNLLEYALGGDPESGVMISETGDALFPVIAIESGQAVVRFPVRDDAVSRGITYVPEFSEALVNWSSVDVPALVDGTAPHVPAVPGFLLRTLSWNASDPRRFCRIRVTLSE